MPDSLPGCVPTPPAARAASHPAQRRRTKFDTQAEQVERLRRRVHVDDDTGLPNRRYFVGRLGSALGDVGPTGATLLILRVLRLDALRARLGDDGAGRVLAVVGDVLSAYPQSVPGAFAGRLNASDFALFLPATGIAEETAATLLRTLRATPAAGAGAGELVIGGVDDLQAETAGSALAAADEALARAEVAGPFCIEIHMASPFDEAPLGERAWRVRLDEALREGRVGLAAFPVQGPDRQLLHLECPLRVQLDAAGPFREAKRWIAMASRSRLLPRVDLMAVELALGAIARDGRPRCVHVSAASLATSGFVGEVQRRLEGAPAASRRLWLEVAEGHALDRVLPRLREAGAAWRRHGVHLGVEHAGASMQALARLAGIGLDHVKIDARYVRALHGEAEVREFARGLLALAQGMGLLVIAEGIADAEDLQVLWELGFDGATGPAVIGPDGPDGPGRGVAATAPESFS
jgi:EAL domain-containing protein (putative c-di-GMP-specific phosphodiesterase class I)/GGDEF domain-containing protein